MSPTARRVGFVVDDASLPNIATQLRLLGDQLAPTTTLDLFYHEAVDPALDAIFETHAVSSRWLGASNQVAEILGRIAALTRAGRRYVASRAPDALVGFTNPPVTGTAVGLATRDASTTGVYRHSGDSFREYRFLDGVSKWLGYCHYNGLGRLAVELCDAHVVLGRYGRSELTTCGVDPERIYTVPPAVDRAAFRPEGPRVDSTEADLTGLFVGRLDRRKGADRLQRIVAAVCEQREDVTFLVVGDGPYRGLLRDDLPEDRVDVVGRVPHAELPAYYRAADFLVYPTRIDGLPNVLLEAMASGLVTLAAPVGEIPFYADHTCETVPEFVDAIRHLSSDVSPTAVTRPPPDPAAVGAAFEVLLEERTGP